MRISKVQLVSRDSGYRRYRAVANVSPAHTRIYSIEHNVVTGRWAVMSGPRQISSDGPTGQHLIEVCQDWFSRMVEVTEA